MFVGLSNEESLEAHMVYIKNMSVVSSVLIVGHCWTMMDAIFSVIHCKVRLLIFVNKSILHVVFVLCLAVLLYCK